MSVLDKVFASSATDGKGPWGDFWYRDSATGFKMPAKSGAGVAIDESSALTLSTYFAVLRVLSQDVAKVPLNAYQRLDRGKRRITDHPAVKLVTRRPDKEMLPFKFRQSLVNCALSWGYGVAEIQTFNGVPYSLAFIHSSRIKIDRDEQGLLFVVHPDRAGDPIIGLRLDQVLLVPGFGAGAVGYSLLRYAADSLGLSLAAQAFGSAFFGNGTYPSGLIKHPSELDDAAYKRLKESWVEQYAGPYNAFKPAILEEGAEWQPLGIPPEEAQFLETRQLQVDEICRFAGVTPHKVYQLKDSHYANIEHTAIEHVGDALMPWYIRIEQEFTEKLFTDEEKDDGFFFEHDLKGLLRGDATSRAQYYRELFYVGAISQNEIRSDENENPVEGGDIYYVPSTLVPSTMAAKGEHLRSRENTQSPANADPGAVDKKRRDSVGAFHRVTESVFASIARRQTKAMTRIAAKFKSDPEHVESIRVFFATEERGVIDALSAVGLSVAEAEIGELSPIEIAQVEGVIRAMVRAHLHDLQSKCMASAHDQIQAMMESFETNVPGALATEFINRIVEVCHAR